MKIFAAQICSLLLLVFFKYKQSINFIEMKRILGQIYSFFFGFDGIYVKYKYHRIEKNFRGNLFLLSFGFY